jgi:very-short-patch-repair endonuclease
LEDLLWIELKKEEISAERQLFIEVGEKRYALDFAIDCKDGKIDIETDGNYHHTNPEDVQKDKHRANDLATKKWGFLRFTTEDIHERMPYCIDKIKQTIDGYGGLKVGRFKPRRMSEPKEVFQPSFFDFTEE